MWPTRPSSMGLGLFFISMMNRKRSLLSIMAKTYHIGRGIYLGYRTKRVGFIGDGASKLLAPSLF